MYFQPIKNIRKAQKCKPGFVIKFLVFLLLERVTQTQRMVFSLTNASGLIPLAHHRIPRRNGFGYKFPGDSSRVSYNKHVGGYRTVSVRQSPSEEPLFWMSDVVWSTRSVLSFMAEQPSQLKFIEWPSFTSTVKTATLSLFLVAVFIVALSSVDSALCYILALILRKAP